MRVQLVLMGPPGAGKGTQANRLRQDYGLVHISTGDMLRDEVRRGTPLGREAQGLINQGKLVSDDVICRMMEERLAQPDVVLKGFILDGFPRSRVQAERLRVPLTAVLQLCLDDDVIVERLSLRRTCPSCGKSYHLKSNPPRSAGVCDFDGTRLLQREDDCETVIRNRLRIYHEQTEPVIDYFMARGMVHRIDASQPIERVEADVERVLTGARAKVTVR